MDTSGGSRQRLDQWLVEHGVYASRARARDAILRGEVLVSGRPAAKPGQIVEAGDAVEVSDPARGFVSRSALKLAAALDAFSLSPEGADCLDVGASTGGFTEVLLQRGAARVIALDVGHGQLAPSIAGNPRVISMEGVNARELTPGDLPYQPNLIVADVSFISLKLVLPPVLALATAAAAGAFLIKPQFEVGRQHVGKGGLVRDEAVALAAVSGIEALVQSLGWRLLGRTPSPIAGGDGNREYLIGVRRG
ncbi:MAG: TlyA family RNA methyltransferase [Ancalomicrobiaceae bacterium]|nr:TlyA family RNA methyltransferase [Ancalomicrobiaceae bacterium]